MIERTIEKVIKNWLGKNKIIIIYGARQVGKTTLMKKIASYLQQDYLWLDCDEPDVRTILTNKSSTFLKSLIANKKYLFIDEAQRVKDIGITLKIIFDNIKNVQIVASGSSSFELANEISEPLTGRKIEFVLYPFSFGELVGYTNLLEEKRILEKRIIYGYYPDVVIQKGNEIEILRELTTSYLYKDLFEYEKIRKPALLEKLLQALALQISSEVNNNELSRLIGIDKQTIEKYLDLLEKSFVIYRLNSFSRNLRNELKKSKKIYFIDNGVRNALIKSFNPIDLRDDIGKLWENFFISEMKKKNGNERKWVNSFFWRTIDKQEIDYIEEFNSILKAYQIKWNPEAKIKIPPSFAKTYKDTEFIYINSENFWEYLI
ncbi:MAG: ATP-binding protein [Candidatus Kapabacteria bacterium]|nr:ATP-binding protein [Candidatus Kapabacteria bacterium]